MRSKRPWKPVSVGWSSLPTAANGRPRINSIRILNWNGPGPRRANRSVGRGAGAEIQLTDAMADLLIDEAVYAFRFQGTHYDCGSKLGYVDVTLDFAMVDPQLESALKKRLRS